MFLLTVVFRVVGGDGGSERFEGFRFRARRQPISYEWLFGGPIGIFRAWISHKSCDDMHVFFLIAYIFGALL